MRSQAHSFKIPVPVWEAFRAARQSRLAGFPSDNAALVALILSAVIGKTDVTLALALAVTPLDIQDRAYDSVRERLSAGTDPAEAVARVITESHWARSTAEFLGMITPDAHHAAPEPPAGRRSRGRAAAAATATLSIIPTFTNHP